MALVIDNIPFDSIVLKIINILINDILPTLNTSKEIILPVFIVKSERY